MNFYRKNKRASALKRIRSKFGRNSTYEVLLFCSNTNVYAQIINIKDMKVETSSSTLKFDKNKNHKNIQCASLLGVELANKCKERGIDVVNFNRGEKIFHGVIKSFADSFYNNLH